MAGDLLELIADLHGVVLYLVAAGLAFGEAAAFMDFLIPGEVGLVIVAAAGQRRGIELVPLILIAAVAASAGDSFSYYLGRRFGPGLAHRWRWSRRIIEPKLKAAHDRFTGRGGVAVFVARWVGALRAAVPFVAGSAGMPYGRFLAWDLPAALGWSAVIVSLGWYLGEDIADVVDKAGWWLSLGVAALLVGWYLWHRHKKRATSGAA